MPFYSSFAVRVCIGLVVDFTLVDMLAIVATLASQHGFPVLFAIPLHASQSTFAIGLVAPLADLRVALTAKRSQLAKLRYEVLGSMGLFSFASPADLYFCLPPSDFEVAVTRLSNCAISAYRSTTPYIGKAVGR